MPRQNGGTVPSPPPLSSVNTYATWSGGPDPSALLYSKSARGGGRRGGFKPLSVGNTGSSWCGLATRKQRGGVKPLSSVNTYTSWAGGVDPTAKLFNAKTMIGGVRPLSGSNTYTSWPGGQDPVARLSDPVPQVGGAARLSSVDTYTSWPGGTDPSVAPYNMAKMLGGRTKRNGSKHRKTRRRRVGL